MGAPNTIRLENAGQRLVDSGNPLKMVVFVCLQPFTDVKICPPIAQHMLPQTPRSAAAVAVPGFQLQNRPSYQSHQVDICRHHQDHQAMGTVTESATKKHRLWICCTALLALLAFCGKLMSLSLFAVKSAVTPYSITAGGARRHQSRLQFTPVYHKTCSVLVHRAWV